MLPATLPVMPAHRHYNFDYHLLEEILYQPEAAKEYSLQILFPRSVGALFEIHTIPGSS